MSSSNKRTSKKQRYDNPPIIEALIDIIIVANIGFMPKIEELKKKLSAEFPTQNPLHLNSTTVFPPKDNKPGIVASNNELLGYRLISQDSKTVLQIKSTGFTISRLGSYTCWDDFRNEAIPLWKTYADSLASAAAIKIVRISVRYINKIVMSPEPVEQAEYFNTYPQVAENRTINNFFMQLQIPLNKQGRLAVVNQSPGQSNKPGDLSIILDIDVNENLLCLRDDVSIWQKIEELKAEERSIFEESITNKTRGLFQ